MHTLENRHIRIGGGFCLRGIFPQRKLFLTHLSMPCCSSCELTLASIRVVGRKIEKTVLTFRATARCHIQLAVALSLTVACSHGIRYPSWVAGTC